jgi:chromosome segregation ATPase
MASGSISDLLRELRDEVKSIDSKFDSHLINFHEDRQQLKDLRETVDHIERLLTRGNGQKPVLTRIEVNALEIDGLKEDLGNIRSDIVSLRSKLDSMAGPVPALVAAEATAKERWFAVAKVAGLITLVVPGILAWLNSCS